MKKMEELTMVKTAIVMNGSENISVFPTFILGSTACAVGNDVVIFVPPAGAPAMKKGVLEETTGKGMPDLMELLAGFEALGGRILVCELAFDALDMKEEDFREGVEIVGATTFLTEIQDATITFSF